MNENPFIRLSKTKAVIIGTKNEITGVEGQVGGAREGC